MNVALQINYNSTGSVKDAAATSAIVRGVQHRFMPEEKMQAKFEGNKARCGNCNSVLGEFKNADGEIKCRKNDCKTINVVKK